MKAFVLKIISLVLILMVLSPISFASLFTQVLADKNDDDLGLSDETKTLTGETRAFKPSETQCNLNRNFNPKEELQKLEKDFPASQDGSSTGRI